VARDVCFVNLFLKTIAEGRSWGSAGRTWGGPGAARRGPGRITPARRPGDGRLPVKG